MSEYTDMRAAYWELQREFRNAAIAEIVRLMPDGVDTVVLEVNDTPRLAVVDMLDANGDSLQGGDYWDEFQHDLLDQIANDMEAYTWDEADSFLPSEAPGSSRYIITREDTP
jgi:hypothetical protein